MLLVFDAFLTLPLPCAATLSRSAAERRRKKATKKAAGRKVVPAAVIGSSPALRDKLRQMRVVQRNLVYVVGLPLDIAKETTLKRREYFGQYGKVLKIVVNRKIGESSGRGDSACAYVTYANPDHARIAILCTDGFNFRRRPIKSMFGTTKYCHQFLAGRGCNNPDCMYLHSIAEGENSFTKDQMQSGRTFTNIVQPGRGPDNPANDVYTAAGFPPSSFASMARKGDAHAAGAGDAVSTPDPATD
ncbi:Cnot4, partial [Symbiodinium sp. KB8]